MNNLLSIFKTISVIFLVFLLHFFVAIFFSEPFNNVNIFFIFLTLFIIGWERGTVIWAAFFVFYVFELYAVTPLGFIIIPGMISIVVIYLLYINIFTNRSWFTSMALISIAMLLNRLLYLAFVYVFNYASGISGIVLKNFFASLFWELLLTATLTGAIFFVLSKKINRFGRDRIGLTL